MEEINKKYNIEIEVLTPLSIGAGAEKDWVKGADFVVNDGNLYKLNLKKMAANGIDLSRLTSYFASKDSDAIIKLLGEKLYSVSDYCIEMPAESDNDIKAFVKNQLSGKPVVPGSSLKGAIRSILYQYLGGKSKDGKEVFGSSNDGDEFMRFIKISDAEFERTTLVNTKIFNLQKQESWKGGWKHGSSNTNSQFKQTGFNTIYESIVPHQLGYASLMMSVKLCDNFNFEDYYRKKINDLDKQLEKALTEDKQRDLLMKIKAQNLLLNTVTKKRKALPIDSLFEIINKHTKDYLTKEKAFFQKYSTDKTDNIIASIDGLLNQIPEDNSYCIMKMSAGSGFHSITGDWQFEDYTSAPLDRKRIREGKVNPKSRKIALCGDSLSLMGFVKLRNIPDSEYAEIENQRAAKQKEAALKLQQEIDAEKRQRETEEKERKEREARNAQFHNLLRTVNDLVDEAKYEDAWNVLQNAKDTYPEFRQTLVDEDFLKFKIEKIQFDRQQQERQQQAEQALRQAQQQRLEAGLSFLLKTNVNTGELLLKEFMNGINRITKFVNQNKDYILTEADITMLFDWLKQIPAPTRKADKQDFENFDGKSWQQISQFVGPDLASQWFSQLKTK